MEKRGIHIFPQPTESVVVSRGKWHYFWSFLFLPQFLPLSQSEEMLVMPLIGWEAKIKAEMTPLTAGCCCIFSRSRKNVDFCGFFKQIFFGFFSWKTRIPSHHHGHHLLASHNDIFWPTRKQEIIIWWCATKIQMTAQDKWQEAVGSQFAPLK